MARILIAYASKHGSTAGIAEAVAKELQAAGHTADALAIEKVASLDGYHAVVIGAPVYAGRVSGGIRKFAGSNREILARIPVATFTVGLAPASGDQAGTELDKKALQSAIAPLQPVAETIFAGSLDPAKLPWFQRWITNKMKSPVGDFRDWNAIAAWARSLPGLMKL